MRYKGFNKAPYKQEKAKNRRKIKTVYICCSLILSRVKFYFPMFWGMVMNDNGFETGSDKIGLQLLESHGHRKMASLHWVVTRMDTPRSDCHLHSKYIIEVLYLKK